jgi:hypothetical protein
LTQISAEGRLFKLLDGLFVPVPYAPDEVLPLFSEDIVFPPKEYFKN